MKLSAHLRETRAQIEDLGQQAGLKVEFDPVSPTAIMADERLVVHAPFFPFVGRKALQKTVSVLEAELPILESLRGEPIG